MAILIGIPSLMIQKMNDGRAVGWKQFMALLTLGSLCWGMEAFMEWHKKANEGAWQI